MKKQRKAPRIEGNWTPVPRAILRAIRAGELPRTEVRVLADILYMSAGQGRARARRNVSAMARRVAGGERTRTRTALQGLLDRGLVFDDGRYLHVVGLSRKAGRITARGGWVPVPAATMKAFSFGAVAGSALRLLAHVALVTVGALRKTLALPSDATLAQTLGLGEKTVGAARKTLAAEGLLITEAERTRLSGVVAPQTRRRKAKRESTHLTESLLRSREAATQHPFSEETTTPTPPAEGLMSEALPQIGNKALLPEEAVIVEDYDRLIWQGVLGNTGQHPRTRELLGPLRSVLALLPPETVLEAVWGLALSDYQQGANKTGLPWVAPRQVFGSPERVLYFADLWRRHEVAGGELPVFPPVSAEAHFSGPESAEPDPEAIDSVLAAYDHIVGDRLLEQAPLTGAELVAARRVICRALKRQAPDRLIEALQGAAVSLWHQGDNDLGRPFLAPRHLLGTVERVERLRGLWLSSGREPDARTRAEVAAETRSHIREAMTEHLESLRAAGCPYYPDMPMSALRGQGSLLAWHQLQNAHRTGTLERVFGPDYDAAIRAI